MRTFNYETLTYLLWSTVRRVLCFSFFGRIVLFKASVLCFRMEIVTRSWTSANNELYPKKPHCNEVQSLSSNVLRDLQKDEKEIEGVNVAKLIEDITQILDRIEGKGKRLEQSPLRKCDRLDIPPLKKLKKILSFETKWDELNDMISKEITSSERNFTEKIEKLKKHVSGEDFVSTLKLIINGPVKEVLKGLGHASLATTGLLVVAHSLEMYENAGSNKIKCLNLLKEMCYVGSLVKDLKEIPKGLHNVIQDATSLIVEGAIICCSQIASSPWNKFFGASKNKTELMETTQKLDRMYMKMNLQISLRVLYVTATEPGKYDRLIQDKGKGGNERFDEMPCGFSYSEEVQVVSKENNQPSRYGIDKSPHNQHMEDVIHDHRTPIIAPDQVPTPPPTQKGLREPCKRCNTLECNETQDEPNSKKMRLTY